MLDVTRGAVEHRTPLGRKDPHPLPESRKGYAESLKKPAASHRSDKWGAKRQLQDAAQILTHLCARPNYFRIARIALRMVGMCYLFVTTEYQLDGSVVF